MHTLSITFLFRPTVYRLVFVFVGVPGMHGADMYDPMKAGYPHMDSTQRYDMLGMHGAEMYGAPPVSSSYSQMSQLHGRGSNSMLIPGHPHHMMMGAHGAHAMSPHGMSMGSTQSPPLHSSMDSMGHIQDIHAG